MIQWKQRLYAFLLRRLLGPFLDESSTQKLHESVDFAIQEGRYALSNINLNAGYISQLLSKSSSSGGITIRQAKIDRLVINLNLRETNQASSSASSLAWRAMQLGSGGSSSSSIPSVALVAEIEISGFYLEIEPNPNNASKNDIPKTRQSKPKTTSKTTTNAQKSFVGSYIDAALASLRLALKIDDVTLRACSEEKSSASDERWIEIKLNSIQSRDLDIQPQSSSTDTNQQQNYTTVLHKSLDFVGLTIKSGETRKGNCPLGLHISGDDTLQQVSTIASIQGTAQIIFRAVEYQNNNQQTSASGSDTTKNDQKLLQQDIEINMNQQCNLSIDETSITQLQTVIDNFTKSMQTTQQLPTLPPDLMNYPYEIENISSDEEDYKTLTGIMKQYQEAYHLTENNQLRGGIMIPSNAYEEASEIVEDDAAVTFDVFFDANEQSFYHYASVLKESIVAKPDTNEDSNKVHTKLRFHLMGGGVKIVFPNDMYNDKTMKLLNHQHEYILITFNEVNLTSTLGSQISNHNFSISHFEIEDSKLESTAPNADLVSVGSMAMLSHRNSIGHVLRFTPDACVDGDLDDDMLVSQAPCITVHVTSDNSGTPKLLNVDITAEPLELVCHQRTISNMTAFSNIINKNRPPHYQNYDGNDGNNGEESNQQIMCLNASCSSITIYVPLLQEVDSLALFRRDCEIFDNSPTNTSSLGIVVEGLSFEYGSGRKGTNDNEAIDPTTKFSCLQTLLFATARVSEMPTDKRLYRTDLVFLRGRTEVQPIIPILIELKTNSSNTNYENNVGKSLFPLVPKISSFKARQEDEDEDIKIEKVLSSKLKDANGIGYKPSSSNDPQSFMLSEAAMCESVVAIHIPELLGDLSKSEYQILLQMVAATSQKPGKNSDSDSSTSSATPPPSQPSKYASRSTKNWMCISLEVDTVSMSLHEDKFSCEGDNDDWNNSSQSDYFSYILSLGKFKIHTLMKDSTMKNFRLLSHELCLYEGCNIGSTPQQVSTPRSVQERGISLIRRSTRTSTSTACPIVYRSHLFTPISQESPSLLVDMTNQHPTKQYTSHCNIYLTLYHLSYRYDVDSKWIDRFLNLVKDDTNNNNTKAQDAKRTSAPAPGKSSLTRLFLTLADVNFDYMSPQYFQSSSRTICRIGDLRVSSNIVNPAGPAQAYRISLGDVALYLSNKRMPYNAENSILHHANSIMNQVDMISSGIRPPKRSMVMPETLLREFGFVNLLTLGAMDAIIVLTSDGTGITASEPTDPKMSISLTFGLVSLHACKDSFACFTGTIGELQAKLTALMDGDILEMKRKDCERYGAFSETVPPADGKRSNKISLFDKKIASNNQNQQRLRAESNGSYEPSRFLLDGYDWTAIDHDPPVELEIPDGEEQAATWYSPTTERKLQLIPQHFPEHSLYHPLSDGDMGAAKLAGTAKTPRAKSRIVIHDLEVNLRLFDGYDWPESLSSRKRIPVRSDCGTIIEAVAAANNTPSDPASSSNVKPKSSERKTELMNGLLDNNEVAPSETFRKMPLPEERGAQLEREALVRRLVRRTTRFFQVSVVGVSLRMDSFDESESHRLVSIMDVDVTDLFIAETVSRSNPLKLIGEWVNEREHPRDTRNGLLMLKMATWHPKRRISPDNEIVNDDCELAMHLLPMRCIVDQRAVGFASAYFRSDEVEEGEESKKASWCDNLHPLPSPLFRVFRVKPWKLKVDYYPKKLDMSALRDGSYVELINLNPLESMVITLQQVDVKKVIGFGAGFGGTLGCWIRDICRTQLHKFVTNARPFEPFANVGTGVSDLIVLPYEAFKNGEDVSRAVRSGLSSLVGTVAFEALSTTSRLTEYAASQMARAVAGSPNNNNNDIHERANIASNPLPSRPIITPKGVGDVRGHALESLARGLQTANYKVVVVPYREFVRNGTTGAAKSVLKGIPVLVVAPITGATEAISYTLLGARNALRPDIRKEEEASQRGLQYNL